MKSKYILLIAALFMALASSSCLDAAVDDDSFAPNLSEEEILAGLEVTNATPGSNKIVLRNTGHVAGIWNYLVGKSTLPELEVLIPFLGEQTITFTATCASGLVTVEKKVTIEQIDCPLDPAWAMLAGEGTDGKKWTWWAEDNGDGTYTYPEGSWGCWGIGGYGWSAFGPNWECFGIGQDCPHDGKPITMDDYVIFDLNGGANVTVCEAGSVRTGSFEFVIGTSSNKADLGWFGTIKIPDGVMLHDHAPWEGGTPTSGLFDIAYFNDDYLILIGVSASGAVLCDPDWATGSTHICLKAVK